MKCFDTASTQTKSSRIRQKLCNRTLQKKNFKNHELKSCLMCKLSPKILVLAYYVLQVYGLAQEKNIRNILSINIIIQQLKSAGAFTYATQFEKTELTIIILFIYGRIHVLCCPDVEFHLQYSTL